MPVVDREEFITARHVVFGNIKVNLPENLTLQKLRTFMGTGTSGLDVFLSNERLLYIYPRSLGEINRIPSLRNCTMANILAYISKKRVAEIASINGNRRLGVNLAKPLAGGAYSYTGAHVEVVVRTYRGLDIPKEGHGEDVNTSCRIGEHSLVRFCDSIVDLIAEPANPRFQGRRVSLVEGVCYLSNYRYISNQRLYKGTLRYGSQSFSISITASSSGANARATKVVFT